MILPPKLLFYLLATVVSFPLFIDPNLHIFKGESLPGNFALPLAVLLLPIMIAGQWPVVYEGNKRAIFIAIWVVGCLAAAVFLAPGYSGWEMFLIYIVPAIVGMTAGNLFGRHGSQPAYTFFAATLALSGLHAFLFLISSVLDLGLIQSLQQRGGSSVFGIFSIYQKYNYYPTLLAYLYFFGCVSSFRPWLLLTVGVIVFGVLFMLASREALVSFVALIGAASILKLTTSRSTLLAIRALTLVVVGFLAMQFTPPVMEFMRENEIIGAIKITELLSANTVDEVTAGRHSVAVRFIDILLALVAENPIFGALFGSAFSTSWEYAAGAHNQYLEWLLRGGAIFLLINLTLIYLAIRNAFYEGRRTGLAFVTFFTVVLCITSSINTPFRAPLTSIFIWLVVGYGLTHRAERLKPLQTPAKVGE